MAAGAVLSGAVAIYILWPRRVFGSPVMIVINIGLNYVSGVPPQTIVVLLPPPLTSSSSLFGSETTIGLFWIHYTRRGGEFLITWIDVVGGCCFIYYFVGVFRPEILIKVQSTPIGSFLCHE